MALCCRLANGLGQSLIGIASNQTCFPAIISCSVATCRANAPRPVAVAVTVVCGFFPTNAFSTETYPAFASVSICASRLPSVAPVSFFSRANSSPAVAGSASGPP